MMIITGNCGKTHPAKRAVTPWAQGPTTRALTGQPVSLDGPQHTARRYPAVPGYPRGWFGPSRLLGWLAGLYSMQTLYWVTDLWAHGSLGTRRTLRGPSQAPYLATSQLPGWCVCSNK